VSSISFRKSCEHYPETIRRIRYFDAVSGLSLVFLTNAFHLPALTIAEICRRRWQIELFFRWIKQYLRLRCFFSNDPNGVRVQVWTAICVYLLVAIAKKENVLRQSLHQVLQVVSLSCLEKVPLIELFAKHDTTNEPFDIPIQLEINGF
jgi:IS4 transposase